MHCSQDPSIIQFLVATIWTLDTLHVSFMCHMLYYYLVNLRCPLLASVELNHCR
ncbi:hypothetical protein EDD17DRAFT_1616370 [Pisolithus thermaeus]|nr:hypothetical protein EDD17DRAFT_1616370 [Pisolithus thermaeus]